MRHRLNLLKNSSYLEKIGKRLNGTLSLQISMPTRQLHIIVNLLYVTDSMTRQSIRMKQKFHLFCHFPYYFAKSR